MMKKIEVCLCWSLVVSALIVMPFNGVPLIAGPLQQHWVTAYYGGWELGTGSDGYLPVSDVDFSAMTDVVYFALVPNPDGTLDTADNDITKEGGAALVKAAHAAGANVLICIGGWATEKDFLAATAPAILNKFVSNLVTFARAGVYNGIDIDWEPLSQGDDSQFVALVKTLRDSVGPNYSLTSTAGSSTVMASAQKYLDQINIMTYDMSGDFPGWVSWFNSPIYNDGITFPGTQEYVPSIDDEVRKYEAAGVPAAKLGIGAEFGGTVWQGIDLPGQLLNGLLSVQYDVPLYSPDTTGIMQKYYRSSYYHWDAKTEACYLSIPSLLPVDALFISYDDSNSIAAKAEYIKEKGLGGIILYELGMGYPGNGTYPLLKTVKQQFSKFLAKPLPPTPPPPIAAKFQQPYPNPFSRSVTIPLVINVAGDVDVEVYNVLGQRVATLYSGYIQAGTHDLSWSGFGHASGVYICTLMMGRLRASTKIVLIE